MNYAYGLPSSNLQMPKQQPKERGLAWCRRVVDHANDIHSDTFIDLITTEMLNMIPERRLSADACLVNGQNSRVFGDHDAGSGSATPRSKLAVEGGISNGAGSTTIILDALRGIEDENLNRGEEGGVVSKTCDSHSRKSAPSPSDEPQFGIFETEHAFLRFDGQLPVGGRSKCIRGSKRPRSPSVGSAIDSSGKKHKVQR